MAKILIVEDNPANMKLAAFLLQSAGHTVLNATDAETGMTLARDEQPNLILMDIQLPGIDGLQATALLRADEATSSIRVIAFTSLTMQGDEDRIRAAGCDDYIPKPLHYQDFLTTVAAQLEQTTKSADTEQLATLAARNRALAGSLDYEVTLAHIAQLAMPVWGAWSIVDLCEPDGSMHRVAVVHPDPAKQAMARALDTSRPSERGDPFGAPGVVDTKESLVLPQITDEMLIACARGTDNLRLLRALEMGSSMTVPMMMRGVVLGVITFITPKSGHQYRTADLPLANDLASRAALAVDNAQLYRAAMGRAAAEAALTKAENRRTAAEIAWADAEEARHHAEVAKFAAEAGTRAKAEFMANISHELRTPLNAIAGYAELLATGIRGTLTEIQLHDVERIRRNQRHLLGLINDVLNFARLELGAIRFDIGDVAVAKLLDDAAAAIGPYLGAKDLHFESRCADDLTVCADAEKAEQVILNLMSNAIKFTLPGGSVTVDCAQVAEAVVIEITDTGPGIAADKTHAIFEPFVRLDSTYTRTTSGTGLGLTISREIARAMGGDLVVESTVGHGSTFRFTLPVGGQIDRDHGPTVAAKS